MPDSLVQTLSKLESELHKPSVRRDYTYICRLLHPDFEEVGRSGSLYSREETVEALSTEECTNEIMADSYIAAELCKGVALLKYRSALMQEDGSLSHHTLRSSIWVAVGGDWKLRYHQGTAAAEVW